MNARSDEQQIDPTFLVRHVLDATANLAVVPDITVLERTFRRFLDIEHVRPAPLLRQHPHDGIAHAGCPTDDYGNLCIEPARFFLVDDPCKARRGARQFAKNPSGFPQAKTALIPTRWSCRLVTA
jgi:hypothetical protein